MERRELDQDRKLARATAKESREEAMAEKRLAVAVKKAEREAAAIMRLAAGSRAPRPPAVVLVNLSAAVAPAEDVPATARPVMALPIAGTSVSAAARRCAASPRRRSTVAPEGHWRVLRRGGASTEPRWVIRPEQQRFGFVVGLLGRVNKQWP